MRTLADAKCGACRLQFRRLDGTMNVAARERAIAEFKESPAVAVLIMSLKAAALGLNLVAANHVILLDLWCVAPFQSPTRRRRPLFVGNPERSLALSFFKGCCSHQFEHFETCVTSACRWNPTVEEQAIDRAHRIGQTRDVHVTRIIIKGAPPLQTRLQSLLNTAMTIAV